MRVNRAIPLALILLAAAGSTHADAAKKKPKPITKTYDVTAAPLPMPASGANYCTDHTEGRQKHRETIKVTGPGTLIVEISNTQGDWDSAVIDSKGNALMASSGTSTGDPNETNTGDAVDTLKYKSKKAQTLNIDACNFAGGPKATVKYTYTYS
jgi:hypothetical protein